MKHKRSLSLALLLLPLGGAFAWGGEKKEKPAIGPEPKAIPPDPTPFVSQKQWLFDLEYRGGDVHLLSATERRLAAPTETPRAIGRFAIELYEGPTLIERVRFDFPLLIEAEDAGAKRSPPSVTNRLKSRIGVLFPATPRGTRLELWDRGTDRRWTLPWPPNVATDGGRADAF